MAGSGDHNGYSLSEERRVLSRHLTKQYIFCCASVHVRLLYLTLVAYDKRSDRRFILQKRGSFNTAITQNSDLIYSFLSSRSNQYCAEPKNASEMKTINSLLEMSVYK